MAEVRWHSRVRLVDEVAQELRRRIYEGRYRPGQRLLQEQVAAELDVSRTPLREALRMLEQERLLALLPRGGLQVATVDVRTLVAAYRLREVVDGLAARLVAETSPPGLGARLAELIAEQERLLTRWDARAWTESNVGFHRAIVEATGNDYVIAQIPLVRQTAQVFVPAPVLEPARAEAAWREHQDVAAAVAAGDPERAEAAARAHVRHTTEAIRRRTP